MYYDAQNARPATVVLRLVPGRSTGSCRRAAEGVCPLQQGTQACDGSSTVFMQLGAGVGGEVRSIWYQALAPTAIGAGHGQR
jgi:hypothetical protein